MSADKRDPIAAARINWEQAGWGDVADGMVAVTSVMRAHQILLARVENALRPYDLSFSLIKKFADVEISVGLLMQLDKLIQLILEPGFLIRRIQLRLVQQDEVAQLAAERLAGTIHQPRLDAGMMVHVTTRKPGALFFIEPPEADTAILRVVLLRPLRSHRRISPACAARRA